MATNAERQAAFRARRKAELERLRTAVGVPKDAKAKAAAPVTMDQARLAVGLVNEALPSGGFLTPNQVLALLMEVCPEDHRSTLAAYTIGEVTATTSWLNTLLHEFRIATAHDARAREKRTGRSPRPPADA